MPAPASDGTPDFTGTLDPANSDEVIRAGIDALRMRLPSAWTLDDRGRDVPRGEKRLDAELTLTAPNSDTVSIVVEAKRQMSTRGAVAALDHVQQIISASDSSERTVPMVMARYLAPATRERIIEAGAGYADATGNVYLACVAPSLFLRDRGADRDPWRGPGRPRGALKGRPASRVVRALIDYAPPYTIPELAQRAGASSGSTYRVVDFLEEEDLLQRERYGPIVSVRWRAVLERWSQDYGFADSNPVSTYLEPRGLGTMTEKLATIDDLEYVVTGTLAAERLEAYAPARFAMIYVRDADAVAEKLGLRPTSSGTNVVLASTSYDAVFERTETVNGLHMAAASQVAVDLMTGPGRNPNEAVALMDWMEDNEDAWRR